MLLSISLATVLRKPLSLPLGSEKDESESMRIRYIAVEQNYQRKGISSAIVQKLLSYAVKRNVSYC